MRNSENNNKDLIIVFYVNREINVFYLLFSPSKSTIKNEIETFFFVKSAPLLKSFTSLYFVTLGMSFNQSEKKTTNYTFSGQYVRKKKRNSYFKLIFIVGKHSYF